MKHKYTIQLKVGNEHIYFNFDNYLDVQRLIYFMTEGSKILEVAIFKEEVHDEQ